MSRQQTATIITDPSQHGLIRERAMPMTTVTARVIRQAQERGFRIRTRVAAGRTVHLLDQHGQDGHFGAVYVGQRSGRITGAVLHAGNRDTAGTRVRGALATGRAIRGIDARTMGFPVWTAPYIGDRWTVDSPNGTLLIAPDGGGQWSVRWADRPELLHRGDDLERCQRWAEEYAETHAHPGAGLT